MLDAVAVPDFIAGFIYGMTGDNHLSEIEACYNGSEDLVGDVQSAVKLIEAGDYVKGFAEIGLVVSKFPQTLSTCQNMDDDIAAIESWATIFTEPEQLTKTLSKNWLLHRRTIKEDIANEQSDWAAANYFQAGVDTALALTEAVGPIELSVSNDLTTIPEFVAGFVYGVTGDLQLQELETCLVGASDLEKEAMAFLGDLKHFHLLQAFMDLERFIFNMQKDLAACKSMSADLQTLEAWVSIVKRPEELG